MRWNGIKSFRRHSRVLRGIMEPQIRCSTLAILTVKESRFNSWQRKPFIFLYLFFSDLVGGPVRIFFFFFVRILWVGKLGKKNLYCKNK